MLSALHQRISIVALVPLQQRHPREEILTDMNMNMNIVYIIVCCVFCRTIWDFQFQFMHLHRFDGVHHIAWHADALKAL